MAGDSSSPTFQIVLQQHCERICRPRCAVLFRRGEKASGMFVVLSGEVSLDFGVDSIPARSYGPGALVGLPSTITGHNYMMTATVAEDAELGFLSPKGLDSLLQQRPELCQQLLVILEERITENHRLFQVLRKQPA